PKGIENTLGFLTGFYSVITTFDIILICHMRIIYGLRWYNTLKGGWENGGRIAWNIIMFDSIRYCRHISFFCIKQSGKRNENIRHDGESSRRANWKSTAAAASNVTRIASYRELIGKPFTYSRSFGGYGT